MQQYHTQSTPANMLSGYSSLPHQPQPMVYSQQHRL
jgi:hypothetical protein